jgi:hypothetical protein
MKRRLLKIPIRYKREKKQRSFKQQLFRFVSLATVLALLMSSLNFLILKDQPKAHATTFTLSGTWTVPSGMQSATFEAWGGGGSGAGSATNSTGGGGGAGGQYAKIDMQVNVGDVYTVTVAGTIAGSAGSGAAGGDSKVLSPVNATVVLAKGGAGGNQGGTGGSGSTASGVGSTVFAGGNGGNGSSVSATAGGGGGGAGSTGNGGSASGASGGAGTTINGGNGGSAGSNGTGGAGSNYGGGGANKSGGTGAQGLVVITPSSSALTSTIRQEINILDGTLAVSSTSGAIVQLDTTMYGSTASYYFEVVTGSSSASTDTVTLTRKGTTTNDASISLAGTSANTRVRSSAFTPPSNAQTEYVVKTGSGHSIKSARIIVIQSGYPVETTETQIEIGNEEVNKTNTTGDALLTSPKFWHFTAANWNGPINAYVEVTLATSNTASDATADLYTDSVSNRFQNWFSAVRIVSPAPNTAATRYRIPFSPVDGNNYTLETFEGSNTSGKTYSIYNAKIIIDQPSATSWSKTGISSSFTANGGNDGLTNLTSSQVAFFNGFSGNLQTYSFDGTNWNAVGSTLNLGFVSFPCITALSSTRIAYIDATNNQLRTYDFNGSTWSQTGSSLTISTGLGSIAALTSSTVAFADTTNKELRIYSFNGTTWSQSGSGTSITVGTLRPALAALSGTRVALADPSNSQLRTYDFGGSTWTQTGSSFSAPNGGVANITLASLSSSQIAWYDSGAGHHLSQYSFNGSTWSQVGTGLIPNYTADGCGSGLSPIAVLSSTRVAFICGTQSGFPHLLTTYDWGTVVYDNFEPQYLLQNTSGAATGLQGYPSKWDSSEWSGVTSTYENVIDSTNASSSAKLQDIDNANTDVITSTATGNNQVFSSAMTMPPSGHQIDANIIASPTTVMAERIDVVATIYGAIPSNSAPSSPTLTAPSSGATGVSTTPAFTFNDTDPDSDDIQFKINLFQSDCTTTVSMTPSGDMASGQTGWATTFNGTAGSGLTYTSSTAGSGVSFTPTTALSAGTTYCWSVSAKDPGGGNTSTTSSTQLFTTASAGPTTDQQMRGGVYFSGGSKQPIYWAQ